MSRVSGALSDLNPSPVALLVMLEKFSDPQPDLHRVEPGIVSVQSGI